MTNLKRFFVLMMALVMVLCLCACGEDAKTKDDDTTKSTTSGEESTPSSEPSKPSTSEPADSRPVEDGKKTYTVTLVDGTGSTLAGVMVQICSDHGCNPAVTGSDGVAVFTLEEISGYYAYVSADETTKVYFEDGQYDVTIVWEGVH